MLHLFSRVLVCSTLLLIIAGGLVTSTGSGLAVPDWPNTYGWFMFTFPWSKMVGGIFYEHGHRLIASAVGLLTIGLVVWLQLREPRRWVRRLGTAALVAVIAQGLLGGITVLYFLPAPVSIAHAGLAQIFFCLTVAVALVTSRGWREGYPGQGRPDRDTALRWVAAATTLLVYIQILLGATMRHTGAGLAIPDFPLAFGKLLPPMALLTTGPVVIHFAHRLGAIAVSIAVVVLAGTVWRHHRHRRELMRPAWLLAGLVACQIALGGLTVLSEKAVSWNTAHVATGALVLATSLVVTLRAYRARFADRFVPLSHDRPLTRARQYA